MISYSDGCASVRNHCPSTTAKRSQIETKLRRNQTGRSPLGGRQRSGNSTMTTAWPGTVGPVHAKSHLQEVSARPAFIFGRSPPSAKAPDEPTATFRGNLVQNAAICSSACVDGRLEPNLALASTPPSAPRRRRKLGRPPRHEIVRVQERPIPFEFTTHRWA